MTNQNKSTRHLRCIRVIVAVTLVTILGVSARADYQRAVLADHPVGYWPLNSSTDTNTDTQGNYIATDLSGNGNNGIYVNMVPSSNKTLGPSSFISNAMSFNGVNAYVNLGTGTNPAVLNFGGQITLEAWVQPVVSEPNADADILAKGYDSAENDNELEMRIQGSGFHGGTFNETARDQGADNADYFETTNWTYVVLTYNGTNWNFYANSQSAAAGPDNVGAINWNQNWAIGNGTADGAGRLFQGNICQLAIYNYGLSPEQIQAHFLNGVNGTLNPTVNITNNGSNMVLTWPSSIATLQQSTNLSGIYTDIFGATSPWMFPATSGSDFFRLRASYPSFFNPDTEWFSTAGYGAFISYSTSGSIDNSQMNIQTWNSYVNSFDVNAFAQQCQDTGVKYVLFMLGQNSGFYCSPNPTLETFGGVPIGSRCSTRDLPMDLYNALSARNIQLMLYLPSDCANSDTTVATNFGLSISQRNGGDYVINPTVNSKWSNVIKRWSIRYGGKVKGWWFDGYYPGDGFTNNNYAQQMRNAVLSGNPDAVMTFNYGYNGGPLLPNPNAVPYEDYTAGEDYYNPLLFSVMPSRWIGNEQGHIIFALEYNNGWGDDTAPDWYANAYLASVLRQNKAVGGVVTMDVSVDWTGAMDPALYDQLTNVQTVVNGEDTGAFDNPIQPYKIFVENNTNYLIGSASSPANGGAVQSSLDYNNSLQQWRLVYVGGGDYEIAAINNPLFCLAVSGPPSAGSTINVSEFDGNPLQLWRVVDVGGGFYEISLNENSACCLELSGTPADGTSVQVGNYSGNDLQQFNIVPAL